MKAKLDAPFCLTARCKPGQKRTDYWDTSVTGFVLECRSSGTSTFTFRYFDEYGRQRQRKIGNLGEITFAQAQAIAKKWRAEVTMGGDPATRKAD